MDQAVKNSFILALPLAEVQQVFCKSQEDILHILLQSDINSEDINTFVTNYDRRVQMIEQNQLDSCLERLLFSICCFSLSGLQEHIQPILKKLGQLLLSYSDLAEDKVTNALVDCFESLCPSTSSQFICELEQVIIDGLYNALQSKQGKLFYAIIKDKANQEENPIEQLQLQYQLVQIVKKDNKESAFELLEQLFLQSKEMIIENQNEIQKLIKELESAKKFESQNTNLKSEISRLNRQYQSDKNVLALENAKLKRKLNKQAKSKQKDEQEKQTSIYKSPIRQSINISPSRRQESPLTPNEEAEVARSFKKQIKLSRDLENAKDELSLRYDFNLSDAYNLFDPKNKGYISTFDFVQVLTDYFGVYQVRDEINLLIGHYGKFYQTRLRYSEFIQLFIPKRLDYASLLRSRQGAVYPSTVQDVFDPLTKAKLISVIRLLLENEGASERLRQRLTRRSSFSLYQAFLAIDRDRNGYITINQFKEILLDHGIYTNIQDRESLYERYDLNQDRKISYSEFIQGVAPKSPRRY